MPTVLPTPADILSLDDEGARALVRRMTREGTLSDLVKILNADVLTAKGEVRQRAQACLENLGFVV